MKVNTRVRSASIRQRQQVEHQRRRDPRTTRARRPALAARRCASRLRARRAGCGARSRGRARGTRRAARDRCEPRPRLAASLRSLAMKSSMLRSVRMPRQPRSPCRAAAEHPLEHDARVDLHRQRRRRRLPVERVHVRAAVARRRRRRCRPVKSSVATSSDGNVVSWPICFGDHLIERRCPARSPGRRSASAARR